MKWKIEFYKDHRGNEPVKEFISILPPKEKAKVVWIIELLELLGINLVEPHAKHIEGDLWELKPQSNRVLYFLCTKTFVLLHGFRKTTQKTPKAEIRIARARMKEHLNKEGKL